METRQLLVLDMIHSGAYNASYLGLSHSVTIRKSVRQTEYVYE